LVNLLLEISSYNEIYGSCASSSLDQQKKKKNPFEIQVTRRYRRARGVMGRPRD
jgi:hypothetical protein